MYPTADLNVSDIEARRFMSSVRKYYTAIR
jgi:hypothetical protein